MNAGGIVEQAVSQITRVFVNRGLKLLKGAELAFGWNRYINDTQFKICISKIDPTFQQLPMVILEDIPAHLSTNLPHVIGSNKALCYLDKLGVYFDPFEPAQCAAQILDAVDQTLLILTDAKLRMRDNGMEFAAYWNPGFLGYISSLETLCSGVFLTFKSINDRTLEEVFLFSDEDCLTKWCDIRNAKTHQTSCPAIVIKIKERLSISANTDWPPKSIGDFMSWLQISHPGAETHLLEKLIATLNKSLRVFIVVYNAMSGPVGAFVRFNPSIQKILPRYTNKKSKGKVSVAQFRKIIKNTLYEKNFQRILIEDVTNDFLVTRSLPMESFEAKKIALVGCGTVGAHAANLLIKSGAGSGDGGDLILFDGQTLKASNLGRHLLGVKYLNENKAEATKDFIINAGFHSRKVSANHYLFLDNIAAISNTDLIIDATGDEQFSTVLSYKVNKARLTGKKLSILHLWVDANGLAVRALLDDGYGGCYRCLKVYEWINGQRQLKERFELFRNNEELPEIAKINHRCGESYIPFAEGVSMVAAGLAQQMALEFFSRNMSFRFRHIGLHSSVRHTKSQNITQYPQCPCCAR